MNDMMNMMDGMHWGMGLSRDRSTSEIPRGECLGDTTQAADAVVLDLPDDRRHIGRERISGLLTGCFGFCN
jgi:hypothetical protein